MHTVILDEFGHEASFISRHHPQYNTSPVFGYAGFVMPTERTYSFINQFIGIKRSFFQLGTPAAIQWRKKGTEVFHNNLFDDASTTDAKRQNYNKSRPGHALITEVLKHDGHLLFWGFKKNVGALPPGQAKIRNACVVQRLVQLSEDYVAKRGNRFTMVIDHHSDHVHRQDAVRRMLLPRFADRSLIDLPSATSGYFSQLVQAADWLAAVVARIGSHQVAPGEYPEGALYQDRYWGRIQQFAVPGSALMPNEPPAPSHP